MKEGKVKVKTKQEIRIMADGGKKLSRVKEKLKAKIDFGINAQEIEKLADELIEKESAKPSFKMVKGYSWATCINVNEGIVHGIPKKTIIFRKGDIVSIDVGLFYKGFHTDTSFSIAIAPDRETKLFLKKGREALNMAIQKALPGNRVYDISKAMEDTFKKAGYSPIRALVGHGIGRRLHEAPQIPCFTSGKRKNTASILEGAVLAIEAMYSRGKPEVALNSDGWTIKTRDGKIAGLFEETVAVTEHGPKILTN